MTAEFDSSRHSYRESVEKSISFAGKTHEFYLRAKVQHLLRVLRRELGHVESLRLLDVGCGIGLADAMLRDRVALLAGVDQSAGCVAAARGSAAYSSLLPPRSSASSRTCTEYCEYLSLSTSMFIFLMTAFTSWSSTWLNTVGCRMLHISSMPSLVVSYISNSSRSLLVFS